MSVPTSLRSTHRVIAGSILAALALSTLVPATADAAARRPRTAPDAAATAPSIRANEAPASTYDHLAAQAERTGPVSVVIGLETEARPEGALSAARREAQRRAIESTFESLADAVRGHGVSKLASYELVPYAVATVTAQGVRALEHNPNVTGISQSAAVGVSSGDSVAGTSSNQRLAHYWHLKRMGVPTARSNGYDGRGVTVAVLDTGVQASHPAFGRRVVREACFSNYNRGTTGSCPGGTTYRSGAGAARPCTYSSACRHGTHVAGTAVGAGTGLAQRANLIAISVFHNDGGIARSHPSDQMWGMRYVYQQRTSLNIAAVNLSVGSGRYYANCDDRTSADSFYAWVATLRSVGIATVVSSGNEGWSNSIGSPACNSNVVSVGNTTLTTSGVDAVFSTSNSDDTLWLLAPGTHICSAVPGNSYDCWNGTSMAAPAVAGAFAVLRQLEPASTVNSSLTALVQSGRSVTDSRNGVTRSRMNLWSAVVYAYNH